MDSAILIINGWRIIDMFIVDADRCNILNVDNVIAIGVDGKRITATTNTDDIVIGAYCTVERTKAVYEEMLKEAFPPSTWIFQNCSIEPEEYKRFKDIEYGAICVSGQNAKVERFDCGVYYMPEE
jgi:hypothetical protein